MAEFLQQIVNGIMIGSTYAVVALGFGLVFSVMRVLNLAHSDLVMVGAYVAFLVINAVQGSGETLPLVPAVGFFLVVLAAGMGAGGLGGLILERLVIRPTRGSNILIPFIATAGVAIFLQSGAQYVFGPDPVLVPRVIASRAYNLGGVFVTTTQIITLLTAVVMMVALRYYIRHTKWGLATRAVAELPEVSAACGVNVNRVSQLTIGIASAMAGAAGVTLGVLFTSASPFMGLLFGLKSFVCMLVAGNRHIEGIMAVGLMLGLMEAMVTGYVSSSLRDAVAFSLLLAILVFRPRGLFGSYEA